MKPPKRPGGARGQPRSGRGQRDLAQRVKTAKGRKLSSTLWLERQLNDPYVAAARREGYRSRAAFKLLELDQRYRLLRKGQRIVDLGAAPGGWLQVAAETAGPEGRVVAIDLLPIDPVPGTEILQGDFLDAGAPERLKALLGGPADLVLSDMAANTVGHAATDKLRTLALAEAAAAFAEEVLAPGGAFLCKVLQGGIESGLLAHLKRRFATVRHVKPPASRAGSSELYLLAQGFRG
ncbi:MAG TPA: RlmE family RNA methyltransferase [Kiloniellales bacterium]|nr:RlmE family RNA methyltransferase [Kiloniellales bacterium]